jgi:hypothetical protein
MSWVWGKLAAHKLQPEPTMTRFLLSSACAIAIATFAVAVVPVPARAAENDTIRAACAAIGLAPSEAPFAYCVQSLEGAVTRPETMLNPVIAADVTVGSGDTRVGHRSEYACRAVGIDPGTARYSYCVTNLKQTLFDSQNLLAR